MFLSGPHKSISQEEPKISSDQFSFNQKPAFTSADLLDARPALYIVRAEEAQMKKSSVKCIATVLFLRPHQSRAHTLTL